MDVNFYMPISLVDKNQETGYLKDAAIKQKFWFRKNIQGAGKDEFIQLTLAEILLGKKDEFIGLKSLISNYFCLQYKKLRKGDFSNYKSLQDFNESYLVYQEAFEFVVKKSQGVIPTFAAWQRDFVTNHPEYKQDAQISKEIAYEIVKLTTDITKGTITSDKFYYQQIIEEKDRELKLQ